MSRKVARDYTYKLIHEFLFQKNKNDITLNLLLSTIQDDKDKEYIFNVYNGIIDNYDELLNYVSKFLSSYTIDTVYKTDMAAIMLSTYEMKYMKDIPQVVSINEAIELVKKYSDEKSNVYVNGVLSSILKDIKNG
ncbi:MAG: transcription antitermination factor NusB [Clostridia bacterium]|nr:transcription antitermination factor NusB [Clostridia bacterium]